MNVNITFGILALCSALMAGCTTGLSKQALLSSRSDVFTLLESEKPATAAKATLAINATLKTHRAYACPLDQHKEHGTPDYKLVINIDGQVLTLAGDLKQENLTEVPLGHPEQGEGVRYTFQQLVALTPGVHRVIVALPADGVAIERHVEIREGANRLAGTPVYNQTPGAIKTLAKGDFHAGISTLRLSLNGVPL